MKKGLTAILCIVFSLMLSFMGIGYAQLSETLQVNTSLSLEAKKGLYIQTVTVSDGTNATIESYTDTLLTSTVTLGASSSSTATYQITIFNNTNTVYAFDKVLYTLGEGTYDNENITFSLSGLSYNQRLAGGAKVTFTLRFSYASSNTSNPTLSSILNFKFIEYIPGVADHFKLILNTPEMLKTLTDQMADTGNWWDGRANDTYIGNVVGANSNDSKVINNLFTVDGQNMLKLPNINSNITAMIKREDLDNNAATGDENGREMTLYMTADTIGNADVTVYAIVCTKYNDADGWVQLGEMYQGMADTNNYSGWGSANSFNTDTWRASFTYYGVAPNNNATIAAIVKAYKAQHPNS